MRSEAGRTIHISHIIYDYLFAGRHGLLRKFYHRWLRSRAIFNNFMSLSYVRPQPRRAPWRHGSKEFPNNGSGQRSLSSPTECREECVSDSIALSQSWALPPCGDWQTADRPGTCEAAYGAQTLGAGRSPCMVAIASSRGRLGQPFPNSVFGRHVAGSLML